jgi:spermidine/putrescine transport system permease protein
VTFVHRHRGLVPYLLLLPGLAWLGFFFLVPIYYLGNTSLQEGSIQDGYAFTWAWSNYLDAITLHDEQFLRSLRFAGIATGIAFVVSYPLAYWIAFRAGRWKNLLLLLVIAPFFVTYLIRTLAWQNILADQGPVAGLLRDLNVLDASGRLLATDTAVIAGITYNFLPFMVLPLYVSLEQIDGRLIEAAQDLYASRLKAFLRVTLPLSVPGIFAGTLLTFIPSAGDFINAELLGSAGQLMIGNVIQSRFLAIVDYPSAAALSFVLMSGILVGIFLYTRLLGSERLTGG